MEDSGSNSPMFASSLRTVMADSCEGDWPFLPSRFLPLAVALLQHRDLRHSTQTLLCAAIAARQLHSVLDIRLLTCVFGKSNTWLNVKGRDGTVVFGAAFFTSCNTLPNGT